MAEPKRIKHIIKENYNDNFYKMIIKVFKEFYGTHIIYSKST